MCSSARPDARNGRRTTDSVVPESHSEANRDSAEAEDEEFVVRATGDQADVIGKDDEQADAHEGEHDDLVQQR